MKSLHLQTGSVPRVAAVGLLTAALLGGVSSANAGPALLLTPSATNVQGSQTFNVKVTATGVTDLFGFQFDVSYNPNLYAVTGVTEGTFLGTSGATFYSPGTIDNTAGTVSFVFDTIVGAVSGVSGSGLLSTISFTALATASGSGRIGLDNVSAVSSTLDLIDVAPVAAVAVAVASVTPPVPEPAVWTTLLLGLIGLVGMRWQRSGGRR